jgi:hypothetical protein
MRSVLCCAVTHGAAVVLLGTCSSLGRMLNPAVLGQACAWPGVLAGILARRMYLYQVPEIVCVQYTSVQEWEACMMQPSCMPCSIQQGAGASAQGCRRLCHSSLCHAQGAAAGGLPAPHAVSGACALALCSMSDAKSFFR